MALCLQHPKSNVLFKSQFSNGNKLKQIISKCLLQFKKPKSLNQQPPSNRCSRYHLPLPFQSCVVLFYRMEEAIKPS